MNGFRTLVLLGAAISAVPASAEVSIEAATGDWSKLPQLSQRGYQDLNEKMQAKLFEIAESKQCPSFGLTQGRLDFSITFAVQYAPDGSLARVILPQLNCAEAESVAGGALLEMLQSGDYAPTGKSKGGWYQGGLRFSFAGDSARAPAVATPVQSQVASAKTNDMNEIRCEKAEEIGTRLVTKRVCMTRAQWEEQRQRTKQAIDLVQMQRGCKGESGC
jgi:hypothetical protein